MNTSPPPPASDPKGGGLLEVTFSAAMQLRAMLRTAGVQGVPGVRLKGADERARSALFEIVIEERAEPQDRVSEARGIRFYADANTAAAVEGTVLDLEGSEFVFRQGVKREQLERDRDD